MWYIYKQIFAYIDLEDSEIVMCTGMLWEDNSIENIWATVSRNIRVFSEQEYRYDSEFLANGVDPDQAAMLQLYCKYKAHVSCFALPRALQCSLGYLLVIIMTVDKKINCRHDFFIFFIVQAVRHFEGSTVSLRTVPVFWFHWIGTTDGHTYLLGHNTQQNHTC